MVNQHLKTIAQETGLSAPKDTSLWKIIELMNSNEKGVVVILETSKPTGILTERDMVEVLHKGISLDEIAGRFAKKSLITAQGDRSIGHALNLTIENNIRRIVITDDSGRFIGVVTQQDLLKPLEDDFYRSTLKIKHVVDKLKNLLHISAEDPLSNALETMVSNRISAVPVITDGIASGIITEKDILRLAGKSVSLDERAGDHMSKPVISVDMNTDLVNVVKMMNQMNIRRVVIKSDSGRATGIITIRDVLRNLEVNYSEFLERKLKHTKDVLNLLPEMLLEVTDDGNRQLIVWANERVINNFGLTVLDSPVTSLIPEDNWGAIYQTLVNVNKIEGVKYTKGDKVYELSGFFIRTEGESEIGRFQLLIRDITEDIRLATTDPLTGLYNRRFTNEFLLKEIERSKRLATQFSVIISDIDDFKDINDTYGHSAGDLALKFISDLVTDKLRNSDIVGRYGGDELVFIMPETNKETASRVIDRIRMNISDTGIPLSNGEIVKITISFGVASYPADGQSSDRILMKGDERLYRAKAEGKNRVVY